MANTRIRIEVLRDRQSAEQRALWMTERDFKLLFDTPAPHSKVIYDAIAVSGVKDIAEDDDGEVWLVIGEKI
jgi:hypothetical protein